MSAFGTYACMYGFRKPFTGGLYVEDPFSPGLKAWLVASQVLGYTASKMIGIRVIAEMHPQRRIRVLVLLIAIAEAAWVLFGLLPSQLGLLCLFLNGLPLGMVFGLVLGFLEGRRLSEFFITGLCCSFIVADGVAKTVGMRLLEAGIPERWMPAAAGGLRCPAGHLRCDARQDPIALAFGCRRPVRSSSVGPQGSLAVPPEPRRRHPAHHLGLHAGDHLAQCEGGFLPGTLESTRGRR